MTHNTCPHGHPVDQHVGNDGYAFDVTPECCNLCPKSTILKRYRLPGKSRRIVARAMLRPTGSMGLFERE